MPKPSNSHLPGADGPTVTALGHRLMTRNVWAEVTAHQPRTNTLSVKHQYVFHVRYGYPVLGSDCRWELEAARPSKPDWTRAPYGTIAATGKHHDPILRLTMPTEGAAYV